jgi:large subunit ribosomal protein L7/L12
MANATMSKDEILEAIGNMSVFELADLIEAFKSKFNVTIAAAPVGGAAPAAGGSSPGRRTGHCPDPSARSRRPGRPRSARSA